MEAVAAVISDRSDKQNIVSFAESNRAGQDLIRLTSW
jgi:hypothetical protein